VFETRIAAGEFRSFGSSLGSYCCFRSWGAGALRECVRAEGAEVAWVGFCLGCWQIPAAVAAGAVGDLAEARADGAEAAVDLEDLAAGAAEAEELRGAGKNCELKRAA